MLTFILSWLLLQADVTLPEFYKNIFNEKTLLAVGAVSYGVTLLRNSLEHLINIQGWIGLTLTAAVSLIYGLLQFGLGTDGVVYGFMIGALAAVPFFLTKNAGKLLGTLFGTLIYGTAARRDAEQLQNTLTDTKGWLAVLYRVGRFLLFRK